jgi:hypothetical protein
MLSQLLDHREPFINYITLLAKNVFSIIIYDQYNSVSKLHDLALLQVAQKVEFSPNVTCIYYDETDIRADKGEIMGWGATFVSKFQSSKNQ